MIKKERLERFCCADVVNDFVSPSWFGLAIVISFLVVGPSLSYGATDQVTSEVTGVACTVIGLVTGIVGKMLSFVFLAAGAVAAFVGKWAYVVGGIGAGLLLIIGPRILESAFTGTACTP